jgi:hypothetical protein
MTATQPQASTRVAARRGEHQGWLLYPGILVLMIGILDVIWGIAAIGKAHFFIATRAT